MKGSKIFVPKVPLKKEPNLSSDILSNPNPVVIE